MRYSLTLLICMMILGVFGGRVNAQSDSSGDGIPANCESAPPEQRVLFPRYEFHNERVLLVNWNTGDDALILDSGLVADAVYFRDWVGNCRYLVGTVEQNNRSHFVIWDTQSGSRVVTVEGLRPNPYAYHVFGTRLIVETPDNARLITLPAAQQIPISAPWDEFSNRNFDRRPTINESQGWVVVSPVEGLEKAYDLQTGQEVDDYLRQTVAASAPEALDSCGREYVSYRWPWSSSPYSRLRSTHTAGYYLMHESNQVILYNSGQQVRVLTDLSSPEIRFTGFSENCQYVAVSAQRPGEKVYDTYVWDIQTGREMIFPDARLIRHPFLYLTGNRALIETRNGGYLWKLDSDERIQIVTGAQQESSRYSGSVNNVYQARVVDNRLLAVTVDNPAGVTAFDLDSGAERGFYGSGGTGRVEFVELQPGWLAVYTQDSYDNPARERLHVGLWHLATGEHYYLLPEVQYSSALYMLSEDTRYFIQANDGNLYRTSYISRWDLQNLNADGTPDAVMTTKFLQRGSWRSNRRTLANGVLTVGERHYDIFTGQMIYVEDNVPGLAPVRSAPPAADCSLDYDREITYDDGEKWVINEETDERLARLDPPDGRDTHFVSGECYILATESGYPGRTLLWDGRTYERIEQPVSHVLSFAPDGQTAIVGQRHRYRGGGVYLWNIQTGSLMPLVADVELAPYFGRVHWDTGRNLVFTISQLSVRAFDLQSGQMVAYYEGNSAYDNFTFWSRVLYRVRFIDDRWLALSGNMVTVIYDLNTGENTAIRTNQSRDVQMSPSGRYAITPTVELRPFESIYRGEPRLRIWDLHNLPDAIGERTPHLVLPPDEAAPYVNHR